PTGSAGFAPWVAVRLRDPALSFELGLRALWTLGPAPELVPGTRAYVAVRWTYVAGSLGASLHRGPVFLGPTLELWRLGASSSTTLATVSTFYPLILGVGGRVGAIGSIGDMFTVRSVVGCAYVPIGRPLLDASGTPIRPAPSASCVVAMGLGLQVW